MNQDELIAYRQCDEMLHYWAQILTHFNRAFAKAKEDDSHTNFILDPLGKRILGRWVNCGNQKLIGALNLHNFRFEFLNDKMQIKNSFGLAGRSFNDNLEALAHCSSSLGLDGSKTLQKLHFDIPRYDLSEVFIAPGNKGLNLWQSWRSFAQIVCFNLLNHTQSDAEIRIWPHHFDTGIYLKFSHDFSLGFGLAMADDVLGAPYFYFRTHTPEDSGNSFLNERELSFGRWIKTDKWEGAILALPAIGQQSEVEEFIKELIAPILTSFRSS